MKGLTQGRIVHFIQQLPEQVGVTEYAAIVSRVYDVAPVGGENIADRHADGDVDLHVFMQTKSVVVSNVAYSAEKLPNTWHWIEPA